MALIYQRGIDSSCKFRFRNHLVARVCVEFIKWVRLANYAIEVSGHKHSPLKHRPRFLPAVASRLYDTEAEQWDQTALHWKLTLQLKKNRKTILFGSLNIGLKWVTTEGQERNRYCMIIHVWIWKTEQSSWRKLHTNWRKPDEPQTEFVYGNQVCILWFTESPSEPLHNASCKCVLAVICKLWLHPLEKHISTDTTWHAEMYNVFYAQLCCVVCARD